MSKYFITCTFPKINEIPAIENVSRSVLIGDIYARYLRMREYQKVVYLGGVNEYDTIIQAKQEGLTHQEFCEKHRALHKTVYDWFGIRFDYWDSIPTVQNPMIDDIFVGLQRIMENPPGLRMNPQINDYISKIKCNKKLDKYEQKIIPINCQDKSFHDWFDQQCGYFSILAKNLKPYYDECGLDESEITTWYKWLQSPGLTWISIQTKDDVLFHSVTMPTIILGSGTHLPLINRIYIPDPLEDNINLSGDQIIKLSDELGINEDYWRFYLIKNNSFSWKGFMQTIHDDLVNNIGSFISSCFSLTENCFGGVTQMHYARYDMFVTEYMDHMENFKFPEAIDYCLKLSTKGNQYLELEKPWINRTDSSTNEIMGKANYMCWVLLQILCPFIPRTATRILSYMDVTKSSTIYKYKLFDDRMIGIPVWTIKLKHLDIVSFKKCWSSIKFDIDEIMVEIQRAVDMHTK